MKNRFLLLSLTILLLFLSGCLKTLYPIFTVKDVVYEPRLLGTWKTKTGNNETQIVDISNLGQESNVELPGKIADIRNKGYLVSYRKNHGVFEERYIAFLARIGKYLYFDFYPAEKSTDKTPDEFYMQHYIKLHTSYRVTLTKTGFEMNQVDEGFLSNLLDQKKVRIKYETDPDGNKVITASTEELQQYLNKYADEPGLFSTDKTVFSK